MSIFAISDLHLSSMNKTMDIFGDVWENHRDKIASNWQKVVRPEDCVIIPGDVSWSTYLEDAFEDLNFIHNLNGTKLILKGNHDYFWTTMRKLELYTKNMGLGSLKFIHNNAVLHDNVCICGSRGWAIPNANSKDDDIRIFNHERARLRFSIAQAQKLKASEIIVAMHYPPIERYNKNTKMFDIIKNLGVKTCVYGHLHGKAHSKALLGEHEGVNLSLVSCDYINFIPQKLSQ